MKKRLFNLSAIFLGVLMCFSFSKVNANEITSAFSGEKLTRTSLNATLKSNTPDILKIIGISKIRNSGNYYGWDQNTLGEMKNVWKIAEYSSETSNEADYSNLYYCLNATKGFGYINGDMTESSKDTYNVSYNMKNDDDKTEIINTIGGTLVNSYNKIIWILDHSYIPTQSSTYKNSDEYKTLMKSAQINIDDNSSDLTEDDIEVVQQLVLWYFTNSTYVNNNDNLPSLYLNGQQISHIVEQGEYGQVNIGSQRQAKAEKLYKYFINNADENYSVSIPTLELSNTNAKVVEDNDYYIAGPFSLEGTNISEIKGIVATLNVDGYTLLDADKKDISNNNFKEVINKDFYLKIPRRFITESKQIDLDLNYTYETTQLTLLTNTENTTQPLALVKNTNENININTNININLRDININKIWDDNNNQDGKRPQSIKIQLYANGEAYGLPITLSSGEDGIWQDNELNYTWSKLLDGITYTVKELKPNGTPIENNDLYNADYTVSYSENTFVITNKHEIAKKEITVTKRWVDNEDQYKIRPEEITIILYADGEEIDRKTVAYPWTCTFENLNVYKDGKMIEYTVDEVEVEGYTKIISNFPYVITNAIVKPDLALRKYITAIGEEVIENTDSNYRVPVYDTTNLDDESEETTARYVHKKNPISVKSGDEIIYNITVYNEGEVKARASQITDQLPSGIEYIELLTDGYTAEYDKGTNRLVITKSGENNLEAYVKDSGVLSSETLQIKCKVTTEETNKILTNIAWISEMKDENNNILKNDIDSAVDDIDEQYNKDNMSVYQGKENDEGYYKGQEDDDDFDRVIIEPEEIKTPDLALRKYITTIGEDVIENTDSNYRVPVYDTANLDNESEETTARYVHKKDPITVGKGEEIVYNITVYNEGEVKARASKITDQLPSGLEYVELITEGYTANYNEETNRLVIIKTENNNLDAYIKNSNELSSETVQIKCKVTTEAPTNKILTNIAWISEMKDENDNTFETDRDSNVNDINSQYTKDNMSDYVGKENDEGYFKGQQDDDDFDRIVVKEFDLALRKFISEIKTVNNTVQKYSREPQVDASKIGTLDSEGKIITTATYKHSKQPVSVQKGDIVTYTIRVYNEGNIDGYVNMITDHIPNNLIPIIEGVEGIDAEKYADEIEFNSNWLWVYVDANTVSTRITRKPQDDEPETYGELTGLTDVIDTKLNAHVEGAKELDYIDVKIKCLVSNTAVRGEYITNIAEIISAQDINGNTGDGRDSELGNTDITNIKDYKNEEAINSNDESYVPGQEDDDDFEKLIVKEFDLALRKFIIKVNEKTYSRQPEVDTSKLGKTENGKTITTATYIHSKEPVIVETGDIVTYKIRIYNEGTISGYADEITDNIPKGLEFLPDSSKNVEYKWKMLDKDGNETDDISKAAMIKTDYLSQSNENNLIKAIDEIDGVKELDYKDVEVQFKVVAKAERLKDNIIINEAQISADSDNDIDSIPNRDEKYDYETGKNEDDIDYEPIKLQYFDLALRKFITKVNTTDYNNRYPEIIFGNDGKITYKHTKDPVLVATGDTVIYTIRIYNEGEKAGTATQIKDNIPEGLEFLPDNEVNKENNWQMLDENGEITNDVIKAKSITTDSLKDEVIEALLIQDGQNILSYKDVEVAFKVTQLNNADKIIVNTAEISKDSDDDVDSIPDNTIETEDDIDKEYIKVEFFDLALKKWVTATKVTVDGKTTTTKTGFTEDSDKIAKVDIVSKKLNKTTVKFVYSIKVINEGELPGYAYEVKDYIPTGLKFVKGDNPDWKELKNGQVVTEKLKDTLLNPGESATVEIVLTWKNSATNLQLKTNYAEISKDSGDDIDSTPDNFNKTEDDIDDAQVILSLRTDGPRTYMWLAFITVTILAGGVLLIKKYVIK